MSRFSLPVAALVALLATPGCVTRYSAPSRALGTSVSAVVEHDREDRVLRTEVSAGEYPVERVRLVDARGRVREPDAAVREGPELVGGVRLGTGVGGGYGSAGYGYGPGLGVGTGLGVGRTVGGRVVPGEYVARFLDPPRNAQPWTLRVTTGGDRKVNTEVLLAEVRNREEVLADRDTPLELELPDGEVQRYRTSRGEGGVTRYERVGPPDP